MIKGGTTCFSDMYFFPEAVADVVQRVGMRGFSGAIVIEFPSPYGSGEVQVCECLSGSNPGVGPDEYLQKGEKMISQFGGIDRVHFTVSPHSAYAVSEEHLGKNYSSIDEGGKLMNRYSRCAQFSQEI